VVTITAAVNGTIYKNTQSKSKWMASS